MPRRLAFAAVLLLTGLAGCDDASLDPILDTGRPYTLWGTLDPTAERQAIRVVPIRLQLDAEEGGPADAVVVAEDLDTGTMYAFRDSLVRFDNGLTGSVYLADFQPAYASRYRITVTRPDGAVSTVNVAVPPRSEPLVLLPVEAPGAVVEPVLWAEAPRINAAEVTYLARDASCSTTDVTIALKLEDLAPVKIGWEARVPLSRHREQVINAVGGSSTLLSITLRALVTDADWKPPFGFGFDPEILIEPGTFTNVENGFGFVGGSYETEVTWRLDDDALQLVGYQGQAFGSCGG